MKVTQFFFLKIQVLQVLQVLQALQALQALTGTTCMNVYVCTYVCHVCMNRMYMYMYT